MQMQPIFCPRATELWVTWLLNRLLDSPPKSFGFVFMRTIYLWNVLALFAEDEHGTFMKPSEGISEQTYLAMLLLGLLPCHSGEAFWLWMCSSKSTDMQSPRDSWIHGAIRVIDVIPTEAYKRHSAYKDYIGTEQFKCSELFPFQLVIPMSRDARKELKRPVKVPVGNEPRWQGVWIPDKDSTLLSELAHAEFW